MSELTFRSAHHDDWPQLWKILSPIIVAGETYPYPRNTTEAQARALWMHNDDLGRTTYLAERAGAVVATAYVKPNLPGLGSHVANAGWMVAPAAWGGGIGKQFAMWVIEQAKLRGFTHMQFNAVVVTNTASIRIWESLGFDTIGTIPDAFNHATQGLTAVHIMHRRL